MPHQKVCLFICIKIPKEQKLYDQVVPKAVDEYLELLEKFPKQKDQEKILNPIWHVHNGQPPKEKISIPFSMLLNLVSTSNADTKEILWKFINRFHKDVRPKENPILDKLTGFAINYFKDKVEPNKKFKTPNENEKKSFKKTR